MKVQQLQKVIHPTLELNHILEVLTAQGSYTSDLDCLVRWLKEMDWPEAAMCSRDMDFCDMGHEENIPLKERDNFF